MKKLFKCLAFGLLCISSSVFATTVDQLKMLVDTGKFKEAYQLAQSLLDEYEGDPDFDLQYGIAAVDSGHVSEGVFALERVLFLDPENYLAMLELARAYFQLGQFGEAVVLFERVKLVNPPPAVLGRIEQYLVLIEKKTTVEPTTLISSFAELWTGYDSNINAGPDSQTQLVILSKEALGRGDQFRQFRVGAQIEQSYTLSESLLFSANAEMRLYDTEPAQDYKNYTVTGGHLWKREGEQYLLNFIDQRYVLDYEDYRHLSGVGGVWSKQLDLNSVLKAFAGVNRLSYESQDWKNATQTNIGVNYLQALRALWSPLFFAGVFYGTEDPKTDGILADGQVDRRFYGGNVGVQLTPVHDLRVTPSLIYQGSDYRGDDWIYNVRRRDDFWQLALALEWELGPSWSMLADYRYTDAKSNIELYEYDRQQLMLGLRYNFE